MRRSKPPPLAVVVDFQATEGAQLARTGQLPSDSSGSTTGIAGFFDTSDDHEALITRPRELQDNATPSGNAMATGVLLKLAALTNEGRYGELAREALAPMQALLSQSPLGFGQWLQALSFVLAKPREVAVVGKPDAADTQELLAVVRQGYRPFQMVALGAPDDQQPVVPLLQDRGLVGGHAAAYVCRDFACQAPVITPQALEELLSAC